MVLEQFQIRTTSLLAGAGILGLAISFGAQGLVQDVVTGIFLLYEDQFGVGDQVNFPALNLSGTVQEVGIRITLLTGLSGETVIIPNRLILEVKNLSRGNMTVTVTVTVPVASGQNPEEVRSGLQEAVGCAKLAGITATLSGISAFTPGTVVWTIAAPATLATECDVDHQIRECVVQSLYKHGLSFAELGKGQSADGSSAVSTR
jgi:small conductance mechanosensitive channel